MVVCALNTSLESIDYRLKLQAPRHDDSAGARLSAARQRGGSRRGHSHGFIAATRSARSCASRFPKGSVLNSMTSELTSTHPARRSMSSYSVLLRLWTGSPTSSNQLLVWGSSRYRHISK